MDICTYMYIYLLVLVGQFTGLLLVNCTPALEIRFVTAENYVWLLAVGMRLYMWVSSDIRFSDLSLISSCFSLISSAAARASERNQNARKAVRLR